MDASIIPLCLSLFDWAKFRTRKGALKLHALLDYDTGLPVYAVMTDGKSHEIKVARNTTFRQNPSW
ncbi:MAG: transposase [Saprospiraceae bacterium]|nr:transposase [Saprospiraceae bacterium]